MTVVKTMFVKTALERLSRQPGGIRVQDALKGAEANLKSLGDSSLVLIDQGLDELTRLLCSDPRRRPSPEALKRAHAIADGMIGYCATIDLPGLDAAVFQVCRLTDAVGNSDAWVEDAFAPALMVVRAVRARTVSPKEARTLLAGIDRCIEVFASSPAVAPEAKDVRRG